MLMREYYLAHYGSLDSLTEQGWAPFFTLELLYKFGIRVGAIAKIKVMDIDEHGVIIFREENQKMPKRNLSEILL